MTTDKIKRLFDGLHKVGDSADSCKQNLDIRTHNRRSDQNDGFRGGYRGGQYNQRNLNN